MTEAEKARALELVSEIRLTETLVRELAVRKQYVSSNTVRRKIAAYAELRKLIEGSGIMSAKWKETFIPGAAQEVLDGDLDRLEAAFVWHDTLEGHEFWRNQDKAGKISMAGRERLEAMLKEFGHD